MTPNKAATRHSDGLPPLACTYSAAPAMKLIGVLIAVLALAGIAVGLLGPDRAPRGLLLGASIPLAGGAWLVLHAGTLHRIEAVKSGIRAVSRLGAIRYRMERVSIEREVAGVPDRSVLRAAGFFGREFIVVHLPLADAREWLERARSSQA